MSYVICRRKPNSDVLILVRTHPPMTEQIAIATSQAFNTAELSKKAGERYIYGYCNQAYFDNKITKLQADSGG